ncbi:MAG: hypothetical protein ABI644_03590, partial [Arenimonas sp.]
MAFLKNSGNKKGRQASFANLGNLKSLAVAVGSTHVARSALKNCLVLLLITIHPFKSGGRYR